MAQNKQNLNVHNKELLGRMNFLYQASMLMANNSTLSSYYARQCQSIGKKAQIKISPDVKRNFCRRCAVAQQPGRTTDLEILTTQKSKRRKRNAQHENIDLNAKVFMNCRKCGYKRKFIVNPNYNFWLEKSEAGEEVQMPKIKKAKHENENKDNSKATDELIAKKESAQS